MSLPNFKLRYSDGQIYSLNDYADQVILVVNIASQCGLKDQLKELENLYQDYKDRGFTVLGFPSNQFRQERLENGELRTCYMDRFGVTFPINELIKVNGPETAPIYRWLKREQAGLLGRSIKWNYTKFLINRRGQVVKRYLPTTSPSVIAKDIEIIL